MRREYVITDEAGIHARPASLLVGKANEFTNDIMIEYNGKEVTLKSIMFVMSLGVKQNSTVSIEVTGENQEGVFDALEKILKDHKLI